MDLTERDYWLAFSCFPGIGSRRFPILLKFFGGAKKAWQAKTGVWRKLGASGKLVDEFLEFRKNFDPAAAKVNLQKALVSFMTLKDDDYPKLLKEIADPPFVLYFKGNFLTQDNKALAIVGTRKITPYGREVTEKFAAVLALRGFTIVSGLARGVDSVAHRSALANGGRTIAVLGAGLDQIYPPEHKGLAEDICQQGALVSEYPLGIPALPTNFPLRNRIISGLSLGVLVTEGESKSGTKITAKYAAEQGREVFAVPGPITSPTSSAPAELIKIGAKLASNIDDILEEIGLGGLDNKFTMDSQTKDLRLRQKMIQFSSKEEEQIWQLLLTGAKHIDELVRNCGLSTAKVMSLLTLMEVSGKVKGIGNGIYMAI